MDISIKKPFICAALSLAALGLCARGGIMVGGVLCKKNKCAEAPAPYIQAVANTDPEKTVIALFAGEAARHEAAIRMFARGEAKWLFAPGLKKSYLMKEAENLGVNLTQNQCAHISAGQAFNEFGESSPEYSNTRGEIFYLNKFLIENTNVENVIALSTFTHLRRINDLRKKAVKGNQFPGRINFLSYGTHFKVDKGGEEKHFEIREDRRLFVSRFFKQTYTPHKNRWYAQYVLSILGV